MSENKDFKGLYNIEAEQIILGKIISNNDYFIRVSEFLRAEYFYELAHKEIYKYITKTLQRGSIVADSVTLKNFFDTNEILSSIGGSNYLSILLSNSTGILDVVSYAKLIKDLATKRSLAIIGENIVNNVYDNTSNKDAQEQIEVAESKLFELSDANDNSNGFMHISSALAETIGNIKNAIATDGHVSGISCRLTDVDKLLGGFQGSDLIIVAGRPSMGKSTLAINFAYNAAITFQEE